MLHSNPLFTDVHAGHQRLRNAGLHRAGLILVSLGALLTIAGCAEQQAEPSTFEATTTQAADNSTPQSNTTYPTLDQLDAAEYGYRQGQLNEADPYNTRTTARPSERPITYTSVRGRPSERSPSQRTVTRLPHIDATDEPLEPRDARDRGANDGRTHVVSKGDTLYKLARRYFDDASKWRAIYEANRGVIRNPDELAVGTRLTIPR